MKKQEPAGLSRRNFLKAGSAGAAYLVGNSLVSTLQAAPSNKVYVVADDSMRGSGATGNYTNLRKGMQSLLKARTGNSDEAGAWKALGLTATSKVAIKINVLRPTIDNHPRFETVKALVLSLQTVVPATSISLFDNNLFQSRKVDAVYGSQLNELGSIWHGDDTYGSPSFTVKGGTVYASQKFNAADFGISFCCPRPHTSYSGWLSGLIKNMMGVASQHKGSTYNLASIAKNSGSFHSNSGGQAYVDLWNKWLKNKIDLYIGENLFFCYDLKSALTKTGKYLYMSQDPCAVDSFVVDLFNQVGGLRKCYKTVPQAMAAAGLGSVSYVKVDVPLSSAPDVTPPALAAVIASQADQVQVTFSEPVQKATAEAAGNYAINSITVIKAILAADNKSVTLTVSPLKEDTTYTLTVNQVKDIAGNTIAANAQKTFTYKAIDVNEGLVAYWNLEEGNSTTAQDITGNGHTATLKNGTKWTTGKFGGGLEFDGTDDHVSVAHKADLSFSATDSFSVAAWAYVAALPSSYEAIVAKTGTGHYGLWVSGQKKWVFGGATNVVSDASVTIGWHQVVVTQDGTARTRKIFVDGAEVGSGASQAGQATGDLCFGNFGTRDYFKGKIDEVRIYDRALTPQDIQQLGAATGLTDRTILQHNRVRNLAIAPNPFRVPGILTVRTSGIKGNKAVSIHDLEGRAIRSFKQVISGSARRIVWDGRDDRGLKVKPGTYLFSLDTSQGQISRRVMVVR